MKTSSHHLVLTHRQGICRPIAVAGSAAVMRRELIFSILTGAMTGVHARLL
ncbi:hypothetical protein [Candidatus Vallotia cooleyia]|uniref:hypothetical protein n=1 Tax=Candidatus Vallotiella adelgis TaxID=1177211 RepID=UPI001D02249F|nr:hypothetical protein [Candidatus Vallotia cooleyia]UDG81838.1 hypothetical protein GJV44_00040 [Candidatus Vallotia cooleyia]